MFGGMDEKGTWVGYLQRESLIYFDHMNKGREEGRVFEAVNKGQEIQELYGNSFKTRPP
jgi:hypothetical protein